MNTALGKTVVKNWYDETIKLRTRKEKGYKSKMLVKGKELPLELNQGLMKWYSTRPTTARPKLVIFVSRKYRRKQKRQAEIPGGMVSTLSRAGIYRDRWNEIRMESRRYRATPIRADITFQHFNSSTKETAKLIC